MVDVSLSSCGGERTFSPHALIWQTPPLTCPSSSHALVVFRFINPGSGGGRSQDGENVPHLLVFLSRSPVSQQMILLETDGRASSFYTSMVLKYILA